MFERFENWLTDKFSAADSRPPEQLRQPGAPTRTIPRPTIPAAVQPAVTPVGFEPSLGAQIEDAGPGKNVLFRNIHIREDTGTHETLKIIDESLLDSDQQDSFDPYNSGQFDRSRNWGDRFSK